MAGGWEFEILGTSMKKHDSESRDSKNTAENAGPVTGFAGGNQIPPIPLIAHHPNRQVGHRDTLERVVSVLELLAELDYGKGLSPNAESGLYWVQMMLIESLNYVSRALEADQY
jgi:hypothetical protein